MDAISQRLKEMDPDTFQRFCFQLLKDRHPGLEVKHVEGKGGDEGLDVFAGELFGKPSIWQCKSFPNGVGKSQKSQIKKSLKTALTHFSPAFWILCLSVDMDAKARRWFEKLKKSYESTVKIDDLSASEIVGEVIHRRSLRNHFFPGAAIDPVELKRLITKTGDMSTDELERITDANVEEFIERLKERDPRFNYQVVFDGDLGPPSSRGNAVHPSLVMSMWTEGKTVNVIARDVASLRANPPQFHTTFKGTGVQKYQALLKTGAAQEFEADELGPFETDWVLMSTVAGVAKPYKLRVGPSPVITSKRRSVRIEFVGKSGKEVVRYELMELRPVRTGTEEFEFSLSGRSVPFKVSVVASILAGEAALTIHFDATQRNPRVIKKSLDALNLLRPSGTLRIFDLETEKVLLEPLCSLPEETPQQSGRRAFINDVVVIADRFGLDLRLPDKITEEDLSTIFLVKQYMVSGTLELDNISCVVTKSEENRELLPQQFATGKISFGFVNTQHKPAPKLFGTAINTGPVVLLGEAEISNLSETLQAIQEAAIGTGVAVSLKPMAPVRVSLSSSETEGLGLKPSLSGGSFFLQNGGAKPK